MGYYTSFKLSYEIREPVDDVVENFKARLNSLEIDIPEGIDISSEGLEDKLFKTLESDNFCNYSPLIDFVNGNADCCKWYEHDEDMVKLSKMFPGVLFTLRGEGEESGDLWVSYYLNGKHQLCKAEAVYPEFDESKFQ